MSVIELLRITSNSCVQGYKTRIVHEVTGEFVVLGKPRNTRDALYSVEIYNGNDEARAVEAFMKNEGPSL